MMSSLRTSSIMTALVRSKGLVHSTQQRLKFTVARSMHDPYEEETAKEQEKIKDFLTPLGLDKYSEKFTSWDHMMNLRSHVLKEKMGMSCQERKLLRKKANNWRLTQYFMTGVPYQYTHDLRHQINKKATSRRDDSSEDEMAFILPTKEGFCRTYLHYPGARQKDSELLFQYTESAEYEPPVRMRAIDVEAVDKIINHDDYRAMELMTKEILTRNGAAKTAEDIKPFKPAVFLNSFNDMIRKEEALKRGDEMLDENDMMSDEEKK